MYRLRKQTTALLRTSQNPTVPLPTPQKPQNPETRHPEHSEGSLYFARSGTVANESLDASEPQTTTVPAKPPPAYVLASPVAFLSVIPAGNLHLS